MVKIWGSVENILGQRQERLIQKSRHSAKSLAAKEELADLKRKVRKLQKELAKAKKPSGQNKSKKKKKK